MFCYCSVFLVRCECGSPAQQQIICGVGRVGHQNGHWRLANPEGNEYCPAPIQYSNRQHCSRNWWWNVSRLSEETVLPYSCKTTVNNDLLTLILPLYSIKPSFLNLFMKKFTRDRVVPIMLASVSWETFGSTRTGWSCFP
jgi:hypothetical protein